MTIATILLFTMLALVFAFTPGPAVLVTVSNALSGGLRQAIGPIVGIHLGNTVWITLAATGIIALIEASYLLFTILRWAGIAYLLYMGVRMILSRDGRLTARAGGRAGFARGVGSGLAVQLSNPKALIFVTAFLPQFIDPHAALWLQMAVLLGLTILADTIALGLYAAVAATTARLTMGSGLVRWLDRVAGGLLVTAGIGLALIRPAR